MSTSLHLSFLRPSWPRDLPNLRPAARRRQSSWLEQEIRRAAQKSEPIRLGSFAEPFDPALPHHDDRVPGGFRGARDSLRFGALIKVLRRYRGLVIEITTSSPWILRDLTGLVEVDEWNVVTLDVPFDPASSDDRRLVYTLAEHGLTTRVAVDAGRPESELRAVFEAARQSWAFDVVAWPTPTPEHWLRFEELRLEYGFPRCLPGRG